MLENWFVTDIAATQQAIDYSYDYWLVAASVAVAIFASLTAFKILDRYRAALTSASRAGWLATGAVSLGGGVWAMHFVAMLAIRMNMAHSYGITLTIISVVIAVIASALGLHIAAKASREKWHLFPIGGIILGAGIGGMHYTGMTAMHMNGIIRYDPALFGVSILVAVTLSTLTLWLLNRSNTSAESSMWLRMGSGVLMGVSITAMHYCGMAATYFLPAADVHGHAGADFNSVQIAIAIVGGTFLIMQAALVAAIVDRHMQAQSRRIERSEGLLDAIVRNTGEAIVAIDDTKTIRSFNNAARQIFGYSREEAVGSNISILIPPENQAEHDEYLRSVAAQTGTVVNRTGSLISRRKNGERFPFELTLTRMSVQDQTFFVGVCRDVTERVRMEAGIRLLQRIAMASNEAEKPEEALQVAVREICLYAGWPFGNVFVYDAEARNLAPSGIWYPTDPEEFKDYKELTMRTRIEPGVGLPGRVYTNKELDWVPDIAAKMAEVPDFIRINRYPRAMAAVCSGLKAAFAFPISVGDQVVAVLEFCSSEVATRDPKLLELVSNIVGQLGRVFERELSERKLVLEQQFVQSITTNLFESVLVINSGGAIEFANPAAQRALAGNESASLEGVRADHIFQLTDGETATPFKQSVFYEALEKHTVHVSEDAKFILPDDRVLTVAFACAPVRGRTGHQSAVISFRDTSELRKAQSDALQSSKLASVGELAAGIAHEINSPIQFIGDNLGFIREANDDIESVLEAYEKLLEAVRAENDPADALAAIDKALGTVDLTEALEDTRDAADQSLRGVERIARIILAMKEFSHPGSKNMDEVDLNHAIESTTVVCRNEWKTSAELVMDLQEDLPLVTCFAGELNQVFLNMIVNAAHAIRAKNETEFGRISISTRAVGDEVEIKISDTGSGIPREIRNKIFDPFFTTKGVGKGTGQGLAISHDVIVNKHGGKIEVDSEVGRGSTFTIHIPIDCRSVKTEAA